MTFFGKLNPDGTISEGREIAQSDLLKCPFAILVAEHYRADGSCKCDDADHRAMMIAEWEYTADDFANIPLRRTPEEYVAAASEPLPPLCSICRRHHKSDDRHACE